MRLAALLVALAVPAFAGPSGEGASAYTVETSQRVKVKKGAAGKAHVEIVPRSDAHVSPDAPVSLTVAGAEGLKPVKAKLGRADSKETAKKGIAFDVPFTAEKSGALTGKLSFFICTEKLCERQTKELAMAVEVE